MKKLNFLSLAFALACTTTAAYAADMSPAGTWATVSDKTGNKTGLIRVNDQGGTLSGTIVKIFPVDGHKSTDLCQKCPSPFTNKPILGMTVMWGVAPNGANSWSGGQILDPEEGHIYGASATLSDDGKQLQVRGHWGPFGRTQTWYRVK